MVRYLSYLIVVRRVKDPLPPPIMAPLLRWAFEPFILVRFVPELLFALPQTQNRGNFSINY